MIERRHANTPSEDYPETPAGTDRFGPYIARVAQTLPFSVPDRLTSSGLVLLLGSLKKERQIFQEGVAPLFPSLYAHDPRNFPFSPPTTVGPVIIPDDLHLHDSHLDFIGISRTPLFDGAQGSITIRNVLEVFQNRRRAWLKRFVEDFADRNFSGKITIRRQSQKILNPKAIYQDAVIDPYLPHIRGVWCALCLPCASQPWTFTHWTQVRPDVLRRRIQRTGLPSHPMFSNESGMDSSSLLQETMLFWDVYRFTAMRAHEDLWDLSYLVGGERITRLEVYYEVDWSFEELISRYGTWLDWFYGERKAMKGGRGASWMIGRQVQIKLYTKPSGRVRFEVVFRGDHPLLTFLVTRSACRTHEEVYAAIQNAFSPFLVANYYAQVLATATGPRVMEATTDRLEALLRGCPPCTTRGWSLKTRERALDIAGMLMRGENLVVQEMRDATRQLELAVDLDLAEDTYRLIRGKGGQSRMARIFRRSTWLEWALREDEKHSLAHTLHRSGAQAA